MRPRNAISQIFDLENFRHADAPSQRQRAVPDAADVAVIDLIEILRLCRRYRSRGGSAARSGIPPAFHARMARGPGSTAAAILRCADMRQRGEQARGIGMKRPRQDFLDRPVLDHLPRIHRQHARAAFRDEPEIVGDEQDRRAGAAAKFEQQIHDLRLNGHVERGRRLVGDQQTRLAHQRHRDHHALAHAAGQAHRIHVGAIARPRNADRRQRRHGALIRLLARHLEMRPHRLGDLIADGKHRIERAHRLLKDHADAAAADLAHAGFAERHQIAPLEQDFAGPLAAAARQQTQD